MSRLIYIVISIMVIGLSSPSFADEKAEKKAQVMSLYQQYKDSLAEDDNQLSLNLTEQIYVLAPSAYGRESKTNATVVFNLAQMHGALEQWPEAAKFYSEHINILDSMKVPKDDTYFAKLLLLSEAYSHSIGDDMVLEYGERIFKVLEQIYTLAPDVYGRESIDNAMAVLNLAQMHYVSGHWQEAAKIYSEHLDILDAMKVPEDKTYLANLRQLSKTYNHFSEYKKAIQYAKRALRVANNIKIPRQEVADVELELGTHYYGGYGSMIRDAKLHFRRAYKSYADHYGEKHVNTARVLFWLAKFDLAYDKNEEAVLKLENALATFGEYLPEKHDRMLQIHTFLVKAYEAMGEREKATEHCIAVAKERPVKPGGLLKPIYAIAPVYPRRAQEKGKSGYVILGFTIDEEGYVKDIEIVGGQNVEYFGKSARKVASKWRYAPTIKDGNRVKTEGVTHTVTFEMVR